MVGRSLVSLSLAALLAVVLLALSSFAATDPAADRASAAEEGPPNLVVINADDLSVSDYETLGILRRSTGDKGIYFENAAVTTSVCCPSRVSTFTGRYVHNHGVRTHVGPNSGATKFENGGGDRDTLAVWLDGAGYETILAGKYLNGYKSVDPAPPGWDRWFASGTPSTTHNISDDGDGEVHVPQDRDDPDYQHWEDALGDRMVRGIRQAPEDAPLFLYYGSHAPHTPLIWPPRHDGAYKDARLPEPPGFNEADVSDKPRHIRGTPRIDEGQKADLESRYAERLRAMISVVDQIGRIEATLADEGRLENTVFIFTSDNGFHIGEHRQSYGKLLPYEEDIRVPMAVWEGGTGSGATGEATGVPRGQTRAHPVLNIDLAPTLASLAGAEIPWQRVDGRDFSPLLGETPDPRKPLDFRKRFMAEGYDTNAGYAAWKVPPTYHSVRDFDQRFAYTRYAGGETEYYDMLRDPYQLESAHDRLTPRRQAKLDAVHRNLKRCAGPSCRRADGGSVAR